MNQNDLLRLTIIIVVFIIAALVRRRWRPSTTAFGTARWASEELMRNAGMLGNVGLIIGRTMSGKLIRVKNYCHILLVGATGSGKSMLIIPILLSYVRGSVVCVDITGNLNKTCGKRRAANGQHIIRLAPFESGADRLNILDTIPVNSPMLIDSARAIAESIVVRGQESDSHWNDKAVQILCAILVLILIRFEGEDRSLNSLQEIASDQRLLYAAADKLDELGGLPARMGSQIRALFEKKDVLTKEGSSVMSTAVRHLSFLDSEMVAKSVASSTFDPAVLLRPGTTLFIQIPPDQLQAQRGLFRCYISALVRMIAAKGDERAAELLFLIDEASALGSLLQEALVRGRVAGIRLFLAYQSDSQVQAAFPNQSTLLYDNCTVQLYLGPSSIENAERLSKSLGERTQLVEGYSENTSRSWNVGGNVSNTGRQVSKANSINYSVNGRALLRPDEILRMSDDHLIALLRGMPPILARRIRWYQDPDFRPYRTDRVRTVALCLLLAAVAIIGWWFVKGK